MLTDLQKPESRQSDRPHACETVYYSATSLASSLDLCEFLTIASGAISAPRTCLLFVKNCVPSIKFSYSNVILKQSRVPSMSSPIPANSVICFIMPPTGGASCRRSALSWRRRLRVMCIKLGSGMFLVCRVLTSSLSTPRRDYANNIIEMFKSRSEYSLLWSKRLHAICLYMRPSCLVY